MQLSVVIVNYNVKFFLEQCLHSVFASGRQLNMEVFVVDNSSVDGSVELVREKFPEVHLIANEDNRGFSSANNQAIVKSKGKYVLLLNPDTVVEDDTLPRVVAFMDAHPDAGALGVKMLDGQGKFLPESKRALPTPAVAFYKIFGLSSLFPRSKVFGKYHLGFLDEDQTHKVEILSGAFMLLRKEALNKAGLLDEEFFMYGEDIDLSHRIVKAGYNNYYFPGTRIIHYKGESTKKSSVNYVMVFYRAMIIFARKHFSQNNALVFSLLIKLAIYFRASVALLNRFLKKSIWPIGDALLVYTGFHMLTNYWGHQMFSAETAYYPPSYMLYMVPSYIVFWIAAVYLSGGYDRPFSMFRITRGVGLGTIAVLVVYALLPTHLRFSRALILLGSMWTLFSMMVARSLHTLIKYKTLHFSSIASKRILIAGNSPQSLKIMHMIRQSGKADFVGLVSASASQPKTEGHLGSLNNLEEIINIYRINELVFCAGDISSQVIIDFMSRLGHKPLRFKIAPPEGLYIIGSNSIEAYGDYFAVSVNGINKRENRRKKRLFDVFFSLILIATLPIHLVILNRRKSFTRNVLGVLLAKRTWVGYGKPSTNPGLPPLKPSILHPGDASGNTILADETMGNLNILYARDYKVENDLQICLKGYRQLNRSHYV